MIEKNGGRGGTRTRGPLLAKQVLCQLSYTPIVDMPVTQLDSKLFSTVLKIRSGFSLFVLTPLTQDVTGLKPVAATRGAAAKRSAGATSVYPRLVPIGVQ